MQDVIRYFREARSLGKKHYYASMAAVLLLTAINVFYPWSIRPFLDSVIVQNSVRALLIGCGVYILFFLGRTCVEIFWYLQLDRFSGSFINGLLQEIEMKMVQADYNQLEGQNIQKNRNILFTDILNVLRIIGHHIPMLISTVLILIISLVISSVYSLKISLLICAGAVAGLLLARLSRKRLFKTAGITNQALKRYDSYCTEFIRMIPFIRSNSWLPIYQKGTDEVISGFIEATVQEDKHTYFWSGINKSYGSLLSTIISAVIALPAAGQSIPDLVFYTLIVDIALTQTQLISQLYQQVIKLMPSFRNVDGLRNLEPARGEGKLDSIQEVTFQHVGFRYSGAESDALQDFSLTLQRGDRLWLQGINGSGKSTFVKLLCGLYMPTSGEIRINGVGAREFSQEEFNQKVIYIHQEEKLLNMELKEYLEVLAGREISSDEYKVLLQQVGLPDDIIIQNNGDNLSVGQRKKICILKLILRFDKADIIILDELFSGLDKEGAEMVKEYLLGQEKLKEKILVMIEHQEDLEGVYNKEGMMGKG